MNKDKFRQHIETKVKNIKQGMAANHFDTLVITSGSLKYKFHDDLAAPFQALSYFQEIAPLNKPHCFLIIRLESNLAELYVLKDESDFWHSGNNNVSDALNNNFDVSYVKSVAEVYQQIHNDAATAVISDLPLTMADAKVSHNPQQILNHIDYHRSIKTDWEIDSIAKANEIAVMGHIKAQELFQLGRSELEIHLGYLNEIGFMESDLPYDNIICLNENAATLHHMQLDKQRPHTNKSLLIDAGASFNCYHADITRTYSQGNVFFAEMIVEVDKLQKALVANLALGQTFLTVHNNAFEQIGELLLKCGVLRISKEHPEFTRLVSAFFPHGLGHLLGVQVHDRGGKLQNPQGNEWPRSETYPHLRFLRPLEANQVLTIEPGIYFNEKLLAPLRAGRSSALIDWQLVDKLRPFGGIRIEDNVVLKQNQTVNLTRNAFASAKSKANMPSSRGKAFTDDVTPLLEDEAVSAVLGYN